MLFTAHGCADNGISPLLAFEAQGSTELPEAIADSEAKQVFWTYKKPTESPLNLTTGREAAVGRTIGTYSHGCLAGAEKLPKDGPSWQAMRLSRERFWGHPRLIHFIKTLAMKAPDAGWHGLLVGDMTQARGGPMKSGHASHQSGLDVDIWLTPMPKKRLSDEARETLSAINMVNNDGQTVNHKTWGVGQYAILKLAANQDHVARIFVNPAIKKALCEKTPEQALHWLNKIRPWHGHTHHFHVRLTCDPDDSLCVNQKPVADDHGCGADLARWFVPKKPDIPRSKKPKTIKRVRDLPPACMAVLAAP